jgi:UDP-N-acetylglucosamine 2-epimerase
VNAVERLLASPAERDAMARQVSPFGDGSAATAIVDTLEECYGVKAYGKSPRPV